MGMPKFAVINKNRLVTIEEIHGTKSTYFFQARGVAGKMVAKKHKDPKFKFYRRKPTRW